MLKSIFFIHIIDAMNLSAIDLNLLVAFEALYDTRNVTLAGQRIHRAQPSVSSALDQIRGALAQGAAFDPEAANGRRFTLVASDYADIVLVPHIVARLRRQAPAAHLRVSRLNRATLHEQLDNGSVDIAIGGHLTPPKRMRVTPLYEESFVCIADRQHPALRGRKLTLDRYVALPHALFVPSDDGSTRGVIDASLARLGRKRRVACTFAHIVALPQAVAGTDLIATLARRAALQLAGQNLTLRPLPPELDSSPFRIDMVTSPRASVDGAVAWLQKVIEDAVRDLPV